MMLTALSSHFWRPDFSPAQAAQMFKDYADDLAGCTIAEIEVAIREYRLKPKIPGKMKPFPGSDDLLGLIVANRKHREELTRIGPKVISGSRPNIWWTQPPYLWKSNWREEDIPKAEQPRFYALLKAKRAAGAEGWGANDFYGLERKYADQQGEGRTRA